MNNAETRSYYQESASARYTVLIVISISAFLTPLALSATLVAVPAIAAEFSANAVFASWIPSSFLLSNMIALLPAGRLADRYGRKRMFMAGNLIFIVGCLLAGIAQSIEALLVYRVIQGVGAAMFFSTSVAILSSVFKGFGRGTALGWLIAAVYSGLSAGPLIGGWLTDQFSWHAVFFFQAPLALFGVVFGMLKMKGEWRTDDAQVLDKTGSLLWAAWILPLFIGIGQLPDWKGFALIGVACAFIYLFVLHTRRVKHPLVRLGVVWENQVFSRALLASLLYYGSIYGLIFLLGLYFQYNRGMTPTEAGQMMMLQAMVMAVLAPLSGRLSDRYPAHLLAGTGCLVFAGCLVLLLFLDDETPLKLLAGCLILIGLGSALFSTPNQNNALGAVSEERLGIASALMNMGRLIGQMLGTVIVTMLMSIFIGEQVISPANYQDLLKVVRYAIVISLCFALLAAFYSFSGRKGVDR